MKEFVPVNTAAIFISAAKQLFEHYCVLVLMNLQAHGTNQLDVPG